MSDKPDSAELAKLVDDVIELKRYINNTPEILSLLYDMDLMPEQVEMFSRDWNRMLMLAQFHKSLTTP